MNVIIFTDVNGVIGFGRYAGAYRVATELRQAGYSVQVIEFFSELKVNDIQRIADKFVDASTLFIGFATTLMIKKNGSRSISRLDRTRQNRYSGHLPHDDAFVEAMFSIFKQKNHKVKIVIGGGKSNITTLEGVDYWLWGNADRSVVALADHLKNESPLVATPGKIGAIVNNKDYPYRKYESAKIIWEPHDYLFDHEHLPIEIDRGCIFRCAFCANPLHKKPGEYQKKPEIIEQEMLFNYDAYGTTGYMFCDDTFNDSHKKVLTLHKTFANLPFQLEWTGYGRVDVIHSYLEQRELLLESGLRAILLGIETLHPEGSKQVGKGLHPQKVKETLYYLKESWQEKVITTGSFIVGLPHESEDSIWETVEWLQRDDCPLDDVIFSPLNIRAATDNPNAPLSKIARNPEKYGYKIIGPKVGTGISSDGPQWKNEHMDKKRAEELTTKIQHYFSEKKPFGDWAVYSRLRNLGYHHNELIMSNINESDIAGQADMMKKQMKEDYLGKLLG